MNRVLMTLRDAQRVETVTRLEHNITLPAQNFAGQRAHGVLVLDEQYGLPPSALLRLRCRLNRTHGARGRVRRRQVHFEHGAVAWFAVDPDVTATLFHDAVHRPQTKAHPLALFLRREERLED